MRCVYLDVSIVHIYGCVSMYIYVCAFTYKYISVKDGTLKNIKA